MNLFILVLIVAVFSFQLSSYAQERYSAVIKGTVIDNDGRPMSGVGVTFDNPEEFKNKNCWTTNNTVFTDAEGEFSHHDRCLIAVRTAFFLSRHSVGLMPLKFP